VSVVDLRGWTERLKGELDELSEKKVNETGNCVWGRKMNDEAYSEIVIACSYTENHTCLYESRDYRMCWQDYESNV